MTSASARETVVVASAVHAPSDVLLHDVLTRGDVRISVVIPTHNEAKNLQHVLPLIPDWVHETILVDDSIDDTIAVARQLFPNIRVIDMQQRHGKGAALRAGFAAATGEIIVMMDADGSSDPREIPRFIEVLLGGAYFAKGSRFMAGGDSSDITRVRRFGSQALIWVANQLFKTHFTDMFCGLNAFWKDCFSHFEIDCEGFEVETLLSLRVCKANLEMVEVPTFEHNRIYGTTNFRTIRDGWRVLHMIVREALNGRSVIRSVRMHHRDQSGQVVRDNLPAKERIGLVH